MFGFAKNGGVQYQEEPENRQEDQAIIYGGLLTEVERLINELTDLGEDFDKDEEKTEPSEMKKWLANERKELEGIKKMVTRQVESTEQNHFDNDSSYEKALRENYAVAIINLNNLKRKLISKKEDYYKILKNIQKINDIFGQANNNRDLNKIVDDLLGVLAILRRTPTEKYIKEEKIIKIVYRTIYKVMKLEMLYTGKTRLFDEIKKDEIDTSYVVAEIEEEIKGIDNKDLKTAVNALKSQGLDSKYLLDKNLILLIIVLTNPNILSELIESYEINLDNFEEKIEEIAKKQRSVKNEEDNKNSIDSTVDNAHVKIRKQIIAAAIKSFLLAAGGIALGFGARKITAGTAYYTEKKIYDSSTGETTVSDPEYTSGKEEREVVVREYSPWNEPGYFRDDSYQRETYKYIIADEDEVYAEPEEYLTNHFKKKDYPSNQKTESSKDIPEDYGTYEGNKYIVTMTEKDLTKTQPYDHPFIFGLSLAGITTLLGAAEYGIVLKKYKEKQEENKNDLDRKQRKQIEQDRLVTQYKTDLENLKAANRELEELIDHQYDMLSKFADNDGQLMGQYIKKPRREN